MSEKDTGGPAFPSSIYDNVKEGMTLRQYAAIAAMQGILANPLSPRATDMHMETMAKCALQAADALLEMEARKV